VKSYEITISWRPNANRAERKEKVFRVDARSKASAAFIAAYKLGQSLESYLPGSENVTVRFIRSVW
jgi:hypothetical protein